MEVLIFIIGAVLVIGLVVWGRYQAEQRRAALRNWAAAQGYSFSAGSDHSFDSRYPHFSCLAQGDGRYAYNIMDGACRWGALRAFDYHYETHSTDSKGHRTTYHHYFSAVLVATDLPLKPLYIRHENIFDKIGAFFGFEDINFESAEFSREFRVTAPDRRWAFDVLPQQTMEFMLAAPRFALAFYNGAALAWRDELFSVDDYEHALALVAGILDRLPRSVVNELKGEKP